MRFLVTTMSRLTVLLSIFLFHACSKENTPPPVISSISPAAGSAGTQVTISGTGLDGGQVKFNGMSATKISGSGSALIVTVPASTTGEVTVETSVGKATGPVFTYLSTARQITGFTMSDYVVTIDEVNKKISISVPALTDVTALAPVITVSNNATVSPASGAAQNFTQPVQYTVTAEDGSKAVYTASISWVYGITGVIITSGIVAFPNATTLDQANFSIKADVSFVTLRSQEFSGGITSFTATAQPGFLTTPANGTRIYLNNPTVTIYAKAPNNVIQPYTLQVRNKDSQLFGIALRADDMLAMQAHSAFANESQGLADADIVLRILTTDSYVNVAPFRFDFSERATISPSLQMARDFTNDVIYQVTSESGAKNQFTVRVLRYEMLISNNYNGLITSISASGASIPVEYRSVSNVTGAKLMHATNGTEVACTVTTTVNNGKNILYVHTANAFPAGDYKLQVQLANGSTISFQCIYRAS